MKLMVRARQTFGMADKKMPPRLQQVPETVHQLFLSGLVKVDHHVAAEDHIERTSHGPLPYQVEPGEVDLAAQPLNDLIGARSICLNAFKVFGHE